ncbi:MAG: SDR family NAD(P)-dependent oxidoreductase [bacterium]|nr:short-chain dehydrogenase [Deltaproteobacteria bacterium]MCP4906983.1 SDR family NAD(P)-dependent oxidoreductase [bacterium]
MKKTALITGASAGLGVEFARQLAAQGLDLLLVARRKEKLEEVSKSISEEFGVDVRNVSADLSDPAAPRTLLTHVEAEGLAIDYLINNAGSAGPSLFEEEDWAPQARFLELMMTSVTQLCHHFVPPMRERGFGRVVNVSSFAGRLARPAGAHYGPSKAYLVALTEELALILRGSGVHASALCPGFTHTEFHETAGMMAMKNALPGFMWYDAATVVRDGLRAVERGKPIMVSGRLYRWLDPVAQSKLFRPFIKSMIPGR